MYTAELWQRNTFPSVHMFPCKHYVYVALTHPVKIGDTFEFLRVLGEVTSMATSSNSSTRTAYLRDWIYRYICTWHVQTWKGTHHTMYRLTLVSLLLIPSCLSSISDCPPHMPEGRNSRVNTPGVKHMMGHFTIVVPHTRLLWMAHLHTG